MCEYTTRSNRKCEFIKLLCICCMGALVQTKSCMRGVTNPQQLKKISDLIHTKLNTKNRACPVFSISSHPINY